ncbi:unnamed protein product [Pleuronectes platessa]|uniref:Uncharacterized protein n=1 Tax=Pleuronectes platessa TaxID=8262 RepID=A0A9N7UH28_PLEPL|nr:unnamed protein product [Pleuronectes platessa]
MLEKIAERQATGDSEGAERRRNERRGEKGREMEEGGRKIGEQRSKHAAVSGSLSSQAHPPLSTTITTTVLHIPFLLPFHRVGYQSSCQSPDRDSASAGNFERQVGFPSPHPNGTKMHMLAFAFPPLHPLSWTPASLYLHCLEIESTAQAGCVRAPGNTDYAPPLDRLQPLCRGLMLSSKAFSALCSSITFAQSHKTT